MSFPKRNADIKIQSQVLAMHALTSLLFIYITKQKQKSTHLPIIPQQSIKNAASCELQTYEQTSGLL